VETVEDRLKSTNNSYFLPCLVEDNRLEKDGEPELSCDIHSFPMPCERASVEDVASLL
jgi:hypothetical protein